MSFLLILCRFLELERIWKPTSSVKSDWRMFLNFPSFQFIVFHIETFTPFFSKYLGTESSLQINTKMQFEQRHTHCNNPTSWTGFISLPYSVPLAVSEEPFGSCCSACAKGSCLWLVPRLNTYNRGGTEALLQSHSDSSLSYLVSIIASKKHNQLWD